MTSRRRWFPDATGQYEHSGSVTAHTRFAQAQIRQYLSMEEEEEERRPISTLIHGAIGIWLLLQWNNLEYIDYNPGQALWVGSKHKSDSMLRGRGGGRREKEREWEHEVGWVWRQIRILGEERDEHNHNILYKILKELKICRIHKCCGMPVEVRGQFRRQLFRNQFLPSTLLWVSVSYCFCCCTGYSYVAGPWVYTFSHLHL